MRLDRIVVHGAGLDCAAAAKLFANEPIDERAEADAAAASGARAARAPRSAMAGYLFMSDHFGICVGCRSRRCRNLLSL